MVRHETRPNVLTIEEGHAIEECCSIPSFEIWEDKRHSKSPAPRSPRKKRSTARNLRRLEPVAIGFAAIIAIIGMGCSLFSSAHNSADLATRPFSTVSVTVAPGDTLWSLAQRYEDPSLQPADRMSLIRQANPSLGASRSLSPGETLMVPVTSSANVPEIHLARLSR